MIFINTELFTQHNLYYKNILRIVKYSNILIVLTLTLTMNRSS